MRDNIAATHVDLGDDRATGADHDTRACVVFASATGARCPADAAQSRFS
jgi:hypothetical protein